MTEDGAVDGMEEQRQINLDILFIKEADQKAPDFSTRLHYPSMRKTAMKWMYAIGNGDDGYVIHPCVKHHACMLLDRFFAWAPYGVALNSKMVGMGCLVLADKYINDEEYTFHLEDALYSVNFIYTFAQISMVEKVILETLQWQVGVVTWYDFLHTWDGALLLETEETVYGTKRGLKHADVKREQWKLIYYMVQECQTSGFFEHHLCSMVAAALVLCTRKVLGVADIWPARLEKETAYDVESMEECTEKLNKMFVTGRPLRYTCNIN